MLFGTVYRVKFRLKDGRAGRTKVECRFASANELVTYAKKHIAFECDVPVSDVTITNVLE
jgi:hypothetical protein